MGVRPLTRNVKARTAALRVRGLTPGDLVKARTAALRVRGLTPGDARAPSDPVHRNFSSSSVVITSPLAMGIGIRASSASATPPSTGILAPLT